jgi:hypothetical protein
MASQLVREQEAREEEFACEAGNPDVHGYPGEVNVDPAFEHLLKARDGDKIPF